MNMPFVPLFTSNTNRIRKLSDDQRLELFDKILDVCDDNYSMECSDLAVEILFDLIVEQIECHSERYNDLKYKRSESGKKGGAPVGNTNASKKRKSEDDTEKTSKTTKTSKTSKTSDNEIDIETDIDNDIDIRESVNAGALPAQTNAKESEPSLTDIQNYCQERENNVNAQRFYDYYSSIGWKMGKSVIKDWRAAVRCWENNIFAKPIKDSSCSFDMQEFANAAIAKSRKVMQQRVDSG